MATAGMNRVMLWGDLEGRELDGHWLMGRLVRPEGRTAWFEAIGEEGLPIMLSITEALNDEEELLSRLRAASEIRHTNVVAIREARIAQLDDTPVVVAAMEMTEENLADVLRERTLSAAEGRQVLDATLAALTAVHARGLVHKHIEAASILAIGETIKVRSDCVQMGGSAFGAAAAEDVRCAARMATHAVTGRFPSGENDPVLQLLPEPMARAVRRALTGMAGATEVAALAGTRLELMPEIARDPARVEPFSKAALKVAAGPAESKEKVQEVGAAPAADRESPKQPAQEKKRKAKVQAPAQTHAQPQAHPQPQGPVRAGEAPTRVVAMKMAEAQPQAGLFAEPFMLPSERAAAEAARRAAEEEAEGKWRAHYVIAAAIAVVLVTVFTVYGMMHLEPATQAKASPSSKPAVSAAPAIVVTQPASADEKPAPASTAAAPGAGWRVIVYTYDSETEAQQKARLLARRYPQLEPRVFALKGEAPWMVTLGGPMSKTDALGLRDQARGLGFPDDSYAQNFR